MVDGSALERASSAITRRWHYCWGHHASRECRLGDWFPDQRILGGGRPLLATPLCLPREVRRTSVAPDFALTAAAAATAAALTTAAAAAAVTAGPAALATAATAAAAAAGPAATATAATAAALATAATAAALTTAAAAAAATAALATAAAGLAGRGNVFRALPRDDGELPTLP